MGVSRTAPPTGSVLNRKDSAQTKSIKKKSGIREIPTLSTDADSGTDTNFKRKRDLSFKKKHRENREKLP